MWCRTRSRICKCSLLPRPSDHSGRMSGAVRLYYGKGEMTWPSVYLHSFVDRGSLLVSSVPDNDRSGASAIGPCSGLCQYITNRNSRLTRSNAVRLYICHEPSRKKFRGCCLRSSL